MFVKYKQTINEIFLRSDMSKKRVLQLKYNTMGLERTRVLSPQF